ncbi:MAG: iron chaperone [Micrococcales bacterium]
MAAKDIDKFLASVEEPKRSTLEEMRRRILEIVPDAEQGIKYNMPAFTLGGKCFACIAPFKNHLNYSPYSGNVLNQLPKELEGYVVSKGSMQFAIDKPLPKTLLKKLIKLRLDEIDGK